MNYFITNGKEKLGPFTEQQIVNALRRGQLSMFDMILHEQKSEWVMILQHPDFFDLQIDSVKREPKKKSHPKPVVALAKDLQDDEDITQVLDADSPELVPIHWYLQGNPQSFNFLQVLFLLKTKKATEHTRISKNPNGPWEPLVAWSEFSQDFRDQYQKITNTELPEVHLRRKFPRIPCGHNFIFQVSDIAFKAFCLETSEEGLSLVLKSKRCVVGDVILIKFAETMVQGRFDAKGIVLSEKKFTAPGSDEIFLRMSVRFTHFSEEGKFFIATRTPAAAA